MEELHRLACEWKDHAARLRTMAEVSSSSSKQHLLDTASRWTEMARKAERLAERDVAPREFAVSRAN